MKKTILTLLMMMTMLMMVACGSQDLEEDVSVESVETFSISLTPHMNDITVAWEEDNKISTYEIYRVDVTQDVLNPEKDMTYELSSYEKIAEVSGGDCVYTS